MFNNFGLEIKMLKNGNNKNRKYFYKLKRLDIIEKYLERLESVNEDIEYDMF